MRSARGASLLAALRNPDAAQHGTVPAVAAEPLPEEAGGSGMEASALVAVLAERGRVDRVQLEQALVEAEVNRLEGLISETRRELSDGTLRPKPLDPVPLGYPHWSTPSHHKTLSVIGGLAAQTSRGR